MGRLRGTPLKAAIKAAPPARSAAVLVPGNLQSRTGGYAYDRHIIAGLRERGWSLSIQTLGNSYPFPTPTTRAHTAHVLAEIPDGGVVVIDGLAFGAMAEEAEAEGRRLRLVALLHHPLAAETGLPPEQVARLEASERRALACARLVIVTSHATVLSLEPYQVPADRVVVVEPGASRRPLAHGSGAGPLHLLCVASLTPRKGHGTLIAALATLTRFDWRLTCVGGQNRDAETMLAITGKIRDSGLIERVNLAGELGEIEVAACYDEADVFVLPTFHEGYGMAVAEAIAHGLPVVSTPTGAIPELVGETAGLIVPAGDVPALADALERLMADPVLRARMAEGARQARDRLPTWSAAAASVAEALERVAAHE